MQKESSPCCLIAQQPLSGDLLVLMFSKTCRPRYVHTVPWDSAGPILPVDAERPRYRGTAPNVPADGKTAHQLRGKPPASVAGGGAVLSQGSGTCYTLSVPSPS